MSELVSAFRSCWSPVTCGLSYSIKLWMCCFLQRLLNASSTDIHVLMWFVSEKLQLSAAHVESKIKHRPTHTEKADSRLLKILRTCVVCNLFSVWESLTVREYWHKETKVKVNRCKLNVTKSCCLLFKLHLLWPASFLRPKAWWDVHCSITLTAKLPFTFTHEYQVFVFDSEFPRVQQSHQQQQQSHHHYGEHSP